MEEREGGAGGDPRSSNPWLAQCGVPHNERFLHLGVYVPAIDHHTLMALCGRTIFFKNSLGPPITMDVSPKQFYWRMEYVRWGGGGAWMVGCCKTRQEKDGWGGGGSPAGMCQNQREGFGGRSDVLQYPGRVFKAVRGAEHAPRAAATAESLQCIDAD